MTIAVTGFLAFFRFPRSGLLLSGQSSGEAQAQFTIELSERLLNPATRGVNMEVRLIHALRADGSTASSRVSAGKVLSRRVVDVPNRRTAVITDSQRTKSTQYFPEQDRQAILTDVRAADCSPNPHERPVREEFVLNTRTFVFESVSPMGPNRLRLTLWMAPELKCIVIFSVAEQVDTAGHSVARTEKVPVLIRMEEPDNALFEIPRDYREMSPSEMQTEAWVSQHQSNPPLSIQTHWNAQDQKYDASQRSKP